MRTVASDQGISATSAGAKNATVLAYGLAEGGAMAARRWRLGAASRTRPHLAAAAIAARPHDVNHGLDFSPAFRPRSAGTRVLSLPVQSHELQPLRHILGSR
jgi:NTE family protein